MQKARNLKLLKMNVDMLKCLSYANVTYSMLLNNFLGVISHADLQSDILNYE
jgi:hypothetical protein